MKKLLTAIHPLLWAVVPILLLWAENAENVHFSQVAGVTAVVAGLTVLLTALTATAMRNIPRGAALTSCCLILFFNYGRAFEALAGGGWLSKHSHCHIVISMLWLLLLGLAFFVIRNPRFNEREMARVFTVAASILIVFSVIRLPLGSALKVSAKEHVPRSPMLDISQPKPAPNIQADDPSKPDVYYVILDGYSREDVLKSVYDFDNSEFINWLKDRGFYIGDASAANYPMTHMSLASSLNLGYLDPLLAELPEDSISEVPYYGLTRNPLAGRIFRSQGYRFIHFSTNFRGTEDSDIADEVVRHHPAWLQNEFMHVLLRTTAVRSFGTKITDIHEHGFEALKTTPQGAGPKFVFAHFVLPHHPYVFDQHGHVCADVLLDLDFKHGTGYWFERTKYIEQLRYTNKRTMEAIDAILRNSRQPPIIILQSDHGTASTLGGNLRRLQYRDVFLRERFPILNAYHVPPNLKSNLYASISPVNSFRLVFNHLFDTKYELLPDRQFHTWYKLGNRVAEVTEIVRKGAPARDEVLRFDKENSELH